LEFDFGAVYELFPQTQIVAIEVITLEVIDQTAGVDHRVIQIIEM
jgi:hypothetical protein